MQTHLQSATTLGCEKVKNKIELVTRPVRDLRGVRSKRGGRSPGWDLVTVDTAAARLLARCGAGGGVV